MQVGAWRRWIGVVAAAVMLTLGAVSCSKGADQAPSPSAPRSEPASLTIDGQTANDHGAKDVSGDRSVEVELDNDDSGFYISPTVIRASPGQSITVELKNEGSVNHTFTIDSAGVNTELRPDASGEVDVTLPSSGNLVFYCRFHRSQGMIGEFQVS